MVAWKDGRFTVSGGGATSDDDSSVVLIPGRTVRFVVEGSTIARAPTQKYEPLFVATASGVALTNATAVGAMDYTLPDLSDLLAMDRLDWPASLSRRTSAHTAIVDITIYVQGIDPPTRPPSPSPSQLPTTTPAPTTELSLPTDMPSSIPSHLPTGVPTMTHAPTNVPIPAPTFTPTTDPTLAPSVSLMPTTEAHRTLMVSFAMTSSMKPSSKYHHTMIRQHLGAAMGVDVVHVKEYATIDKGQSTWITYFEIGSYHIDGLRRRLDGRRLDALSTVSSSISDSSFSSSVGGTLGGTVTTGGVNIPTATRPPSLPPSHAPTVKPTRAPTTRVPTTRAPTTPVPSTKPTLQPTTMDTVQVAVELSIASSAAPTSNDKATLKTTIASELSVDESTIRNFVVTSTATTTSTRVRRRHLAATYTWAVSFSVVVSLSALNDDSVTSASAFESVVIGALDSSLESALADAGVEVSVEAVETSTPASDDDASGSSGKNKSAISSAGVAVIAGAVMGGVLLIKAIAWLVRQRRTKVDNWSMRGMGELHSATAGAAVAPKPKQPEAKNTAKPHVATTADL